ncbi:hormogonium polysaccharide biosynthesis glycosyltransferase HpsE [Leptothoe sp. PORK10 BA2]|uniref:hormogonium polysaccharide biosynthesis glycosyltransferase HpsE n=1 Tax=Leptothoe sp. PORK10 BA2 TaxID=3110254 RepID=UPI002B21511D|nr:hormogonium polysaccharide biosynthesis glycosyltransferase HpsE [Leptothoe sp. PORK10 BA2]MEA5463862.1 hormogonium polysaccharide biosynthesis glycosyltransferase HpsE [Leptothoe sp. PORK10 BA2]
MMTVDSQLNTAANPLVVTQRTCLDITVVIPTYNGAARIPEVLDHLKQQVGIDALTWEVIVCDNNSCDRTADVVAHYQQQWPPEPALRYCFVAEQGAAFARQRGVMEAHGHIVAFLDDDNLPAQDWLFNVHSFAQAYPQAGAFGSQIHGNFQGVLPEGFEKIACFLAIVERGNQPHLYNPKTKILPPAAGLAVRRTAWLNAVPERLFLNHKGKSAGLASEDLEAMLHIQKAGWEVWYNSDMVITHQIPAQRLQQDYLVSLLRCVGLSRFYIRWLGTQDWQRFFKVPAYIANDLRKLALHYQKNGLGQNHLNLVAACERSLLTSTLVSPAFLLEKAYQDFWQSRLDSVQLPERQQWLQLLTDAFEKRSLELYQQEVIFLGASTALETKAVMLPQVEILLRLDCGLPDQALASPASFFPTAERYGLMRTLDRRVIQQVCETLAGRQVDVIYSLNLSSASVDDASLPDFIEMQLKRYHIDPEYLCFEISEKIVIDAWKDVQGLVARLKMLGLRVTIDEVKERSATASYMTQLPVDCLKLSKDVVDCSDWLESSLPDYLKIVQQTGVQLVAKGVETQIRLEQLQNLGIQYIQGYQLSRPFPFISGTSI